MIYTKSLNNYSKYLLTTKNLINPKNEAIINKFAFYINILTYNIITLVSIIAILSYNTNKINGNIIKTTKIFINKMCLNRKNKIQGGTFFPSSYFGNDDSKQYNASEGSDIQKIQWEDGLARGALEVNIKTGGCNRNNCNNNKQLLILVGKIFKEHKIKADKKIKQELVNIIKYNLYNIINILKSKSKNKLLMLKSMKNILLKSRMKKLFI